MFTDTGILLCPALADQAQALADKFNAQMVRLDDVPQIGARDSCFAI